MRVPQGEPVLPARARHLERQPAEQSRPAHASASVFPRPHSRLTPLPTDPIRKCFRTQTMRSAEYDRRSFQAPPNALVCQRSAGSCTLPRCIPGLPQSIPVWQFPPSPVTPVLRRLHTTEVVVADVFGRRSVLALFGEGRRHIL